MRQFWPPRFDPLLGGLLGLWKIGIVSTPVCEGKNMEMSLFDPIYSSKFGKMYSFYPPLDPW